MVEKRDEMSDFWHSIVEKVAVALSMLLDRDNVLLQDSTRNRPKLAGRLNRILLVISGRDPLPYGKFDLIVTLTLRLIEQQLLFVICGKFLSKSMAFVGACRTGWGLRVLRSRDPVHFSAWTTRIDFGKESRTGRSNPVN
jgi:hypothetical protein